MARTRKDGTTYYPGYNMRQGYDKWAANKRAAGEPLRQSKIKGVKPEDKVSFEELFEVMKQQPELIKRMMNKGKDQN